MNRHSYERTAAQLLCRRFDLDQNRLRGVAFERTPYEDSFCLAERGTRKQINPLFCLMLKYHERSVEYQIDDRTHAPPT